MGCRMATTTAAKLAAEPTPTTATTSMQRNIQVVGAGGSLETIGAPSKKEAESLLQELLKEEGLLAANDTCTPCSAGESRCCYLWQQGVARVQEPDFSNEEQNLQIHFRLDYEKPFDKELVQALHELPFSSAEDRREFGKKIAEQGIFKASQLQSVRKSTLPAGASPMLAAKFEEAKSSYKSEKLQEPEEARRAREDRKELKEGLEDKLEKGQIAITEAMEAMKTAAQSGSERLKKAAAAKMKRAKEYLDQIQVKDADLDRAEESSKLDDMMKLPDTDTIGGKHVPLNLLIEELGVMRGVSFARAAGPDQSFEAYDIVAQLKPAYTGYKEKDEDQLVAAIAVSPDLTSQQVSIEEDTAADIEAANAIFANVGSSAFSSSSSNFGLEVGVEAQSIFAHAGASAGHQDRRGQSGGTAKEAEAKKMRKLSETTRSLYRSTFYLEPRLHVLIQRDMLDLSSSFEDAVSNITKALPSHGLPGADAYALAWQLFDRFGDHVCPQVLLGGWWRITASYQSTKFQSRIDVSNIASEAIEQSHSQAQQSSVSAGGGGGRTGFSVDVHASSSWGTSSSDSSQKSSSIGLRHVNQTALEDSQVAVAHTWKGGSSGCSPADWRRSLDESTNSNWKVIDRHVDHCFPLWEWGGIHPQVKDLLRSQYVPWAQQFNTTTTSTSAASTTGLPSTTPRPTPRKKLKEERDVQWPVRSATVLLHCDPGWQVAACNMKQGAARKNLMSVFPSAGSCVIRCKQQDRANCERTLPQIPIQLYCWPSTGYPVRSTRDMIYVDSSFTEDSLNFCGGWRVADCFFDSVVAPMYAQVKDGMCVVTAGYGVSNVNDVWSEYLTTICEQAG
ncbi:unnamed protein product [Symbiodinium sp. CCMP2592]|nr:unnamed protein product [Symbiodinium sp. CCMP2592]